jgi:hypothetical protein
MVATFVVKPEAFMQPILSNRQDSYSPVKGNSNFIIMPSRLGFRPVVLYFEACLGDIVPASSEKYRAILPSASEWPHVFTLFLRPLQPLAQALDVFIVRLVLLFVHFQQRPQDFDAMLFLHHTLKRVQTRVQQYGIGLFS